MALNEEGSGKSKGKGKAVENDSISNQKKQASNPSFSQSLHSNDFEHHHQQQIQQYQHPDHQFNPYQHQSVSSHSFGPLQAVGSMGRDSNLSSFNIDYYQSSNRSNSNSGSSVASSPNLQGNRSLSQSEMPSRSPVIGISQWNTSASPQNQSLPSFKTTFDHLSSSSTSKSTNHPSSSNIGGSHPHSFNHQNQHSSSFNNLPSFNSMASSSSSKLSGIVYPARSDSSSGEIERSNAYHTVDAFPLPTTHNVLHKWYAFEKPKAISTFDNPGRVWDPKSSPLGMMNSGRNPPGIGLGMNLESGIKTNHGNVGSDDRQNASLRIYEERLRKREENEWKKREEELERERERKEKSEQIQKQVDLDAASTLVSVKTSNSPPRLGRPLEVESASVTNGVVESKSAPSLQDLEKTVFDYLSRPPSSTSSSTLAPTSNTSHSSIHERQEPQSLRMEELKVFYNHCSTICPWLISDQVKFLSNLNSCSSKDSILLASAIRSISSFLQLQNLKSEKSNRFSEQKSILEDQLRKSSSYCRISFFDLFNSPSIRGVQALYLLAVKEHLESNLELVYLLIGFASRMVKLLGFDSPEALKRERKDLQELRNDWTLVRCVALFDKWISLKLNRSFDVSNEIAKWWWVARSRSSSTDRNPNPACFHESRWIYLPFPKLFELEILNPTFVSMDLQSRSVFLATLSPLFKLR